MLFVGKTASDEALLVPASSNVKYLFSVLAAVFPELEEMNISASDLLSVRFERDVGRLHFFLR